MKNAERLELPVELERRLRRGIDRLGQMRESLEELARIADTIHPLLGGGPTPERAKATPPSRRAVEERAQGARTAATPPPAKVPPTPPSSAPSAPMESEEVPEWRKLFPGLSAQHPGRSK
jgi:hypothetical protein